MPELPEVETLRRDIEKQFSAKRIKRVEISGARVLRRHASAQELVSRVEGHKLSSVRRRGKYLLRRWLEQNLPEARPFAPKQGFTVPIGAWISAQGTRLGPLVAAQPGVAEIAEPDRVAGLFRNADGRRERLAAWTLLFYALWHQAHIVGRVAEGSAFEMLAEA